MKYFCVSDIHGYYDQLIDALNEAGFDSNNPNHTLISCGDNFDRGPSPVEVMNFLQQLPRKILIWGNHEDLLVKCCNRGFSLYYDDNNGTTETIHQLSLAYIQQNPGFNISPPMDDYTLAPRMFLPFFQDFQDFFETKRYIFVHAWIPVEANDDTPHDCSDDCQFLKHNDWRNATKAEWREARWLDPFYMAKCSLQAEKTIVCGHWHCSAGWAAAEGRSEFGEDACFEIFDGDGFVAIDACTAYTGTINVFVVEDEPLCNELEVTK